MAPSISLAILTDIYWFIISIGSALVLVGIMICSRIAALSAFIGSAIGIGVAAVVGVPANAIEQGLLGFNPSLTLCSILMFYVPSMSSSLTGIMASIITVFIQLALSPCLEPYGLPSMVCKTCCLSYEATKAYSRIEVYRHYRFALEHLPL